MCGSLPEIDGKGSALEGVTMREQRNQGGRMKGENEKADDGLDGWSGSGRDWWLAQSSVKSLEQLRQIEWREQPERDYTETEGRGRL